MIAALAADPHVESISPDNPIHATAFSGTVDYGWMTILGLSTKAATLPNDGSGIGVAVIDSGIYSADDLNDAQGHSRIVYRQSFIPNDVNTDDHYGHGMHVAGLIAGNGHDSITSQSTYRVRGIAPNANIVSLRVLDANGNSQYSIVIAAIQKAIALKSTYKSAWSICRWGVGSLRPTSTTLFATSSSRLGRPVSWWLSRQVTRVETIPRARMGTRQSRRPATIRMSLRSER